MEKTIVPYVQDDEHSAPKYIRVGAYAQVHMAQSISDERKVKRVPDEHAK